MVKKFRPVFTNEAIVLGAALLITLPLRTIQHLTNMEQGTGFYLKVDWNIIVYGIVLAAAMGYFIFSTFQPELVSLAAKMSSPPIPGWPFDEK